MFYPIKKSHTLYIELERKFFPNKNIVLTIPQATIRDITEFNSLSDAKKVTYSIQKLAEWWAWKYAIKLYAKIGKNISEIFKYFFYSYSIGTIPESVLNLWEKEKYDYEIPDATIFATVAKEYKIQPRELLNYTNDELRYLMQALQYMNLNKEQKEELQRLENLKKFQESKSETEKLLEQLENF